METTGTEKLGIGGKQADDDRENNPRPLSRKPTQSGRARMSRTSSTAGPRSANQQDTTSSGDKTNERCDDEAESAGVLITELKTDYGEDENGDGEKDDNDDEPDAEEEEEEFDEDADTNGKEPVAMVTIGPVSEEEREEDCDTDLDITPEEEENDRTGRAAYLNLCSQLGVVPVSYFCRHIEDHEIVMKDHGLGPRGARAIARVLKDNNTLERLNLSSNWLEGEGGQALARTLEENDFISELVLSNNKLGTMGAYYIARMLLHNTGLRKIDLSGNDFDDKAAEYFAEAIEHNKNLKELFLSNNEFGEVGGETLGPMIGANDILDVLDLSWNHIRRRGAVAVAKGLKENVHLKKVNLSWNGFGPEGGVALADAIHTNGALLELDVSGNRLDCNSAVLIAKALKNNDSLQILRIGNNPISTKGAVAIVTAIKENVHCAMTLLDLMSNPVEYEFMRTVKEIQKKRDFTTVHGAIMRSGNTSDDIGKPQIDLARKNPLLIMSENIVVNDFRIVNLLKKYDPSGSLSVTLHDFSLALRDMGVPSSPDQLHDISKMLDKNNDGKLYYGDLVEAYKLKMLQDTKPSADSLLSNFTQSSHANQSAKTTSKSSGLASKLDATKITETDCIEHQKDLPPLEQDSSTRHEEENPDISNMKQPSS